VKSKAHRKSLQMRLLIIIRWGMAVPKTLKKRRPKIMKKRMRRKMMSWLITEIMSLLSLNYSEVIQSKTSFMSITQTNLFGLSLAAKGLEE
jgi:hypothetical protein